MKVTTRAKRRIYHRTRLFDIRMSTLIKAAQISMAINVRRMLSAHFLGTYHGHS